MPTHAYIHWCIFILSNSDNVTYRKSSRVKMNYSNVLRILVGHIYSSKIIQSPLYFCSWYSFSKNSTQLRYIGTPEFKCNFFSFSLMVEFTSNYSFFVSIDWFLYLWSCQKRIPNIIMTTCICRWSMLYNIQ